MRTWGLRSSWGLTCAQPFSAPLKSVASFSPERCLSLVCMCGLLCRRGACLLRLSGAASNQGTNWAGVLLEGALVDDATHTALAGILATQKNPQYKSQMKGVACISLEGK